MYVGSMHCVYMYVCMSLDIACRNVSIFMQVDMHEYICMCVHTFYMFVGMYLGKHPLLFMYVCLYACMHECVWTDRM